MRTITNFLDITERILLLNGNGLVIDVKCSLNKKVLEWLAIEGARKDDVKKQDGETYSNSELEQTG